MIRKVLSLSFVAALSGSVLTAVALAGTSSAASAAPFTDWTVVSSAETHTCGIRASRLYCWGNDTYGQLGNNTGGSSTSPQQITSAVDWKSVTTGRHHTCAIRSTGKLYCWGDDAYGQLGNGAGGSTTFAVQITAATDWRSVSAGGYHTCAIRSVGKLYCWGANIDPNNGGPLGDSSGGQLGNGGIGATAPSPLPITSATDWKSVSAGDVHTCAIRSVGKLYCWGEAEAGRVGNGSCCGPVVYPSPITSATDWKTVSAGRFHTCAVRNVGKLYCWGHDGGGQLGNGAGSGERFTPQQITSATDWKSVTAGAFHTCGIRAVGKLYCWGTDDSGQLGNASGGSTTTPVPITTATDWKSVSAGKYHTCGIRSVGKLYCWGYDGQGQLGNGSGGSTTFAVQI